MAKRAKKAAAKKNSKPGQKPVVQNTEKQDAAKAAAAAPQMLISEKKLNALLSAGRSTAKAVTELSGTFGQRVANAVENDHLDRKAFGILRGLDKMEPAKLASTWRNLLAYMAASGLEKRINDVVEMAFGPGHEQAEDDEDDDEAEGGEEEGREDGDSTAARAREISGTGAANVKPFPVPTAVGQD